MSSETARMALPSFVFCTSRLSAMVEIAVTAIVRMAVNEKVMVPTWNVERLV